ncbi:DUF3592 domain-containing protein, partial [Micromonospora sp. CPCC 206061]|uniref:DUF3592 domain-containing protein n=1 Tax=Micromonospora sp. CPCC 206061 TaxID=3122410 RepID=UPI002FEF76FA
SLTSNDSEPITLACLRTAELGRDDHAENSNRDPGLARHAATVTEDPPARRSAELDLPAGNRQWPRLSEDDRTSTNAIVGGVALLGMSIYGFSVDHRLITQGVTTEAKVVDISTGGRGDRITVEFHARDGQAVSTDCRCRPNEVAVGGTVRIRYNPSSPNGVVEPASHRPSRDMAVATLAGAALFPAACVTAWLFLRRKEMPR